MMQIEFFRLEPRTRSAMITFILARVRA